MSAHNACAFLICLPCCEREVRGVTTHRRHSTCYGLFRHVPQLEHVVQDLTGRWATVTWSSTITKKEVTKDSFTLRSCFRRNRCVGWPLALLAQLCPAGPASLHKVIDCRTKVYCRLCGCERPERAESVCCARHPLTLEGYEFVRRKQTRAPYFSANHF